MNNLLRFQSTQNEAGAQVTIRDMRPVHKKLKCTFNGELLPELKTGVKKLTEDEAGVLSEPLKKQWR